MNKKYWQFKQSRKFKRFEFTDYADELLDKSHLRTLLDVYNKAECVQSNNIEGADEFTFPGDASLDIYWLDRTIIVKSFEWAAVMLTYPSFKYSDKMDNDSHFINYVNAINVKSACIHRQSANPEAFEQWLVAYKLKRS